MKRLVSLLLATIILSLWSYGQTSTNSINISEFHQLEGEWKGSLTYMDYQTGKPFTMPADLNISPGDRKSVV